MIIYLFLLCLKYLSTSDLSSFSTLQKWVDYFVMKKPVNCTEIKTKL